MHVPVAARCELSSQGARVTSSLADAVLCGGCLFVLLFVAPGMPHGAVPGQLVQMPAPPPGGMHMVQVQPGQLPPGG